MGMGAATMAVAVDCVEMTLRIAATAPAAQRFIHLRHKFRPLHGLHAGP